VDIVLIAALVLLAAWKAGSLRALGVRGLAVSALLAALASVGRLAFAAMPSVQPASFIIMLCGMALGGGAGLYCGMVTAVLSSFLTSMGPWTLWQALLWGLMGLCSFWMKSRPSWLVALYGLAWGLVFGWTMNLWYYTLGLAPFAWEAYWAACAASFPMDAAHGATNALLLLLFTRPSMRFLLRLAQGNGGISAE